MLRLYNFQGSGNAYKIRLLLTQLRIPFERIEIDLVGGETRSERFRARNPLGQTPFVEFEDGRVLAESNVILTYLADGSDLVPAEPWPRALVQQWMSFEQYRLEPNIGTPRFWMLMLNEGEKRRAAIEEKQAAGERALQVLERHLAREPFMVGGRYGIADISLYAYTHLAEEAGYSLAGFPAIRAWFGRVAAVPGHVPITAELGRLIPWPAARRP